MDFNAEQAAKAAAQAQVAAHQQAANGNAAALRNLEAVQNNSFNVLAQKGSEAVYNSQAIRFDPTIIQRITERRNNPPAEQLQACTTMLSVGLDPLYDLIIKKAQVEPQNAKALLVAIMARLHFATSDMHKHLFDAEVSRLTNEKTALIQHFGDNIRRVEQQTNQRNQQSEAVLRDLQRQISPLAENSLLYVIV